MPIYQYSCSSCGKEFEVLQHNSEVHKTCDEVSDCSEKGELKKLVSSFATNVKSSESNFPSCGRNPADCGCMN
ncbi:MAG: zinc ribbon domain-containing protein [Leptospiraceae bacterium]|nr:zinc ribbon domain-containing protein [Leptospiraceae bacterium]